MPLGILLLVASKMKNNVVACSFLPVLLSGTGFVYK
jgi:hypothetical protein